MNPRCSRNGQTPSRTSSSNASCARTSDPREARGQRDGMAAHADGAGHAVVQRAPPVVEDAPEERRAAPGRPSTITRIVPPVSSVSAGDQDDDADGHEQRARLEDLRHALAGRHAPAADRARRRPRPRARAAAACPRCRRSRRAARAGRRSRTSTATAARSSRSRVGKQPEHEREGADDDHEIDRGGRGPAPEPRVAAVAADRAVEVQHALCTARAAARPRRRGLARADAAGVRRGHAPIVPRSPARASERAVTLRIVESAARTTDAFVRRRARCDRRARLGRDDDAGDRSGGGRLAHDAAPARAHARGPARRAARRARRRRARGALARADRRAAAVASGSRSRSRRCAR